MICAPFANASMAASVTSVSASSSSLTTRGGRCPGCGAGDGRPLPKPLAPRPAPFLDFFASNHSASCAPLMHDQEEALQATHWSKGDTSDA